jgi:hypothetical protein
VASRDIARRLRTTTAATPTGLRWDAGDAGGLTYGELHERVDAATAACRRSASAPATGWRSCSATRPSLRRGALGDPAGGAAVVPLLPGLAPDELRHALPTAAHAWPWSAGARRRPSPRSDELPDLEHLVGRRRPGRASVGEELLAAAGDPDGGRARRRRPRGAGLHLRDDRAAEGRDPHPGQPRREPGPVPGRPLRGRAGRRGAARAAAGAHLRAQRRARRLHGGRGLRWCSSSGSTRRRRCARSRSTASPWCSAPRRCTSRGSRRATSTRSTCPQRCGWRSPARRRCRCRSVERFEERRASPSRRATG